MDSIQPVISYWGMPMRHDGHELYMSHLLFVSKVDDLSQITWSELEDTKFLNWVIIPVERQAHHGNP